MVKTRRMLQLREMGGMSPKKITAKNRMLLPIHFFYAVKSSEFKLRKEVISGLNREYQFLSRDIWEPT